MIKETINYIDYDGNEREEVLYFKMSKTTEKVSKYICLILRHKPETIGITLDAHGWANVDELIEGVSKKYPINMDILEEIVCTDEKQRYSFNEDRTLIRANQGHSIPVDVELEEVEPPEYLFHGTAMKYYFSICNNGLNPKSRLHVHLSSDIPTAVNVGKRHGEPIIFRIRSGEMHRDGFKFYKSTNGVWLTEIVPTDYLETYYNDDNEVVMVPDESAAFE